MAPKSCCWCFDLCRRGREARHAAPWMIDRLTQLGLEHPVVSPYICGTCHSQLRVRGFTFLTSSMSLSEGCFVSLQRDQLPPRASIQTVFSDSGVRKEVATVLGQVLQSSEKLDKTPDETMAVVAHSRAALKLMPETAS